MNSREFSRLAMHLVEKEEKIRELQLRTAAAIVIQAFWKSVLQMILILYIFLDQIHLRDKTLQKGVKI